MIKHAYLIEARGHPGHDVIRNFYQSKNLKDGKIYNRQFRCVGEDEWVTKKVKDKNGEEIEKKGWKGGDGENTINLQQIIQGTYAQMVSRFPILRTAGHRFTPGVATMWTRNEFGQMFEKPIFNTFNTVLEMIVEFHKNDYDGYLRRIRKDKNQIELIDKDTPTAEELIERFSQAREENIQATKDRINSKEYTNTKYFIRPITEYNDLLRYKELCYPKNVWCLMHGKQAWDSYTSNGVYQFYLVLDKRLCNENGDPILENKNIIPAEQGKGHPNDEYGLSMMGIIVDEDGELAYCTSRWNHAGKGDDHTMNVEEISNTLGVNFYQTFKPNHVFQDAVEKALAKYRETDSLDGFNSYYKVGIKELIKVQILKKINILNTQTGELLCDKWFDGIDEFVNGFVRVYLKNKGFNFINTNGKIISKIWFEHIGRFSDGLAQIIIKNKGYNFINTNGEFLCNEWFDNVDDFHEGFASVSTKGKGGNFINTNGELISDIWFDDTDDFSNGFAQVYIENKGYNFINTNGELVSDIWFEVYQDLDYGFILIQKNKKYNILDINKKIISTIWFDQLNEVSQEYMIVTLNGTKYILNVNGDLYDKNNNFIKNVSFNENNEEITNESLKRKYAKELNEVLNLNKRIKRLYE